MFVVEYQGAHYGMSAPRLRDGVKHFHPVRHFLNGTGHMELFKFRPPAARGDAWVVTPLKKIEQIYDDDVCEQIREAVEQVRADHARAEEVWEHSALIVKRSRGALPRPNVFKRLMADPNAFKIESSTEAMARKMREVAAHSAGGLTGDSILAEAEANDESGE